MEIWMFYSSYSVAWQKLKNILGSVLLDTGRYLPQHWGLVNIRDINLHFEE